MSSRLSPTQRRSNRPSISSPTVYAAAIMGMAANQKENTKPMYSFPRNAPHQVKIPASRSAPAEKASISRNSQ